MEGVFDCANAFFGGVLGGPGAPHLLRGVAPPDQPGARAGPHSEQLKAEQTGAAFSADAVPTPIEVLWGCGDCNWQEVSTVCSGT